MSDRKRLPRAALYAAYTEAATYEAARELTCPCVVKERPLCAVGKDCWHFGNNRGECATCKNTGRVV